MWNLVTGGSEPTPCATGEYQPNEGQVSCIGCDSGYNCNQTGLSYQPSCPAGSMCPDTGKIWKKCSEIV